MNQENRENENAEITNQPKRSNGLKNPKKQHLSMEGVAYESGFGSKSTFNTLFKKHIEMTPIQYKKSKNQ